MGVVYKAEDINLGRSVAIKVLPPHLLGKPERRSRFVKEARAAAAVTHPSIATIHEIDEAEGMAFIAMELVEGDTLRDLIHGRPLPIRDAIKIASEVAEGMAAAHRAGIVHRDLKPENVIVGRDGRVKIIDFGLARLLDDSPSETAPEGDATAVLSNTPTQEGAVLGTPSYMSPEQVRGKKVDYRTDLFSFGSTLYEMVTGRPPFKAETNAETMSDVLNKDPAPAASLNPEVPSSVQWILDKCLEKDPKLRYQDTRDLVVDLQHLHPGSGPQSRSFADAPPGARTYPSGETAGKPAWKKAIPLALAGLLLLAGALTMPRLFRQGGAPAMPGIQANSLAVFAFENLKDPDDPERLGQILQELLITDLSGFQPIKVFSSQRLFDLRKQVQGKGVRFASKEYSTDIARRAGAQNMLTGSLSQLGERWILTTQLADVGSGTVVQSQRIDGTDLYAMIDDLTRRILDDLKVVQPGEVPVKVSVREKTTSSLDAYQTYLAGVDLLNDEQFGPAAAQLEKAVAADPEFGQAYLKLAVAKWWAAEDARGAEAPLTRLLEKKLYTSEKEKLMAEGTLAMVGRRWGEGLSAFEELAEAYPDEKDVWYGLGEVRFHYPGGGKAEEAMDAFRRATELDPDFSLAYSHIFEYLNEEKRFDEAEGLARDLIGRYPEKPIFHRHLAVVLETKGDEKATATAIRNALKYNTSPGDRQELYTQLGMAAIVADKPDRQADYLQKALEANPGVENLRLLILLSDNLRGQRDFDRFREWILAGLEENPGHPFYLTGYFSLLERETRFREALEKAESLTREIPEDLQWYRKWLEMAIDLDETEVISRALREAEKRHTSPDEKRQLYLSVGRFYRGRKDMKRSMEYFRMARKTDPGREYADVLYELSFASTFLRRFEEAERWTLGALEINPKHPLALISGAFLEMERGNFESALDYAEKVAEILPDNSFSNGIVNVALIRAGSIDAGAKRIETLFSDMSSLARKWNLLADPGYGAGWLFLSAGETDRAERAFRRAADLDPHPHPLALGGLGITYLSTGRLDEAERTFERILEDNPRNEWGLRGLAAVRLVRGDLDSAQESLEAHWKHGPIDNWSIELLAHLHLAKGEPEKALEQAERNLSRMPDRNAKELVAWILASGDLDVGRGMELAEEALRMEPSWFDPGKGLPYRPPAEHSLGIAHLKMGNRQEAVLYLEKASEASPHRESIRSDLERARR